MHRSQRFVGGRRVGALLLMTLYLPGCTKWKVQELAPQEVVATRQPGRMRVTRTDGARVVLEKPALRGDTLVGTTWHQSKPVDVQIPLSDVQVVAIRGVDGGATVGLIAGTILALLVAIGIGLANSDWGYE